MKNIPTRINFRMVINNTDWFFQYQWDILLARNIPFSKLFDAVLVLIKIENKTPSKCFSLYPIDSDLTIHALLKRHLHRVPVFSIWVRNLNRSSPWDSTFKIGNSLTTTFKSFTLLIHRHCRLIDRVVSNGGDGSLVERLEGVQGLALRLRAVEDVDLVAGLLGADGRN